VLSACTVSMEDELRATPACDLATNALMLSGIPLNYLLLQGMVTAYLIAKHFPVVCAPYEYISSESIVAQCFSVSPPQILSNLLSTSTTLRGL
jgi:hypothetical protein